MNSFYIAGIPDKAIQRDVRTIQEDIQEKFSIKPDSDTPHITFKIPFQAEKSDLERIVEDVNKDFSKLRYTINGFGHFDKRVLYLDVDPSEEMRRYQDVLVETLQTKGYDIHGYDVDKDFHITIIGSHLSQHFNDVHSYIKETYDIHYDDILESIDVIEKTEREKKHTTFEF